RDERPVARCGMDQQLALRRRDALAVEGESDHRHGSIVLRHAAGSPPRARRHLPPADAVSLGIPHWPALAALASTVVLLAALAGLGVSGASLLGGLAAVAAGLWGVSCL